MQRTIRPTKLLRYVILSFLVILALLIVVGFPQVNAVVSTNYQVVSQRTPPGVYTDKLPAVIDSPRSVSGDGRYVVFSSEATNIVANDTNGFRDVFVRDTVNNITTRVNVSTSGVQANASSERGSISYDGRYVVFNSRADTLVAGVTGTSIYHVYMHNIATGITTLIDTSPNGAASNGSSGALEPKVSADGRFVVFMASGTNLVPGFGSSNIQQVYIKDMNTNAIKPLSVTPAGAAGNKDSAMPDISCDGNVVVFATQATNLGVPSGQFGRNDLMVAHLGWSETELNNVTSSTDWGILNMPLGPPQISCDGNVALFTSSSINVVTPGTPFGYLNAYQYNRLTDATIQVSLGNGNTQPNTFQQGKNINASMSGDGRYVVFNSYATNVDTAYPNGSSTGSNDSVYIRDVKKSTTELVTKLPNGDRSAWGPGIVSISADGSTVVFANYTAGTYAPSRSLISGFNTGIWDGSTDVYKTETGH